MQKSTHTHTRKGAHICTHKLAACDGLKGQVTRDGEESRNMHRLERVRRSEEGSEEGRRESMRKVRGEWSGG